MALLSLLRMAFTAAPDEQGATSLSDGRGDMPEIPVRTSAETQSPTPSAINEASAHSPADTETPKLPLAEAAVRLSTLMLCGGEEGDLLRYTSAVKSAAATEPGKEDGAGILRLIAALRLRDLAAGKTKSAHLDIIQRQSEENTEAAVTSAVRHYINFVGALCHIRNRRIQIGDDVHDHLISTVGENPIAAIEAEEWRMASVELQAIATQPIENRAVASLMGQIVTEASASMGSNSGLGAERLDVDRTVARMYAVSFGVIQTPSDEQAVEVALSGNASMDRK